MLLLPGWGDLKVEPELDVYLARLVHGIFW